MDMQMPPTMQIDSASTVKQFREFLSQYNKTAEMCFMDCVYDFTTRKVLDAENNCTMNCLEKFLKMSQRVAQRFQEHQLAQSDAAASSATQVMK